MAKFPLTKKREKWVQPRRDVTLRGSQLNYNASQQIKYQNALISLTRQMAAEVKKQIERLFSGDTSEEFFIQQNKAAALDASIAAKAKKLMNALTAKFDQLFSLKSKTLADSMVEGAGKASKSALHESLKKLSGGLSLRTGVVPQGMEDVASATVAMNVSLIKSIPDQYLKDVTGAVMRSITTGQGIASLIPEIQKYNAVTERRARNIALDQTRKAYNSINKQRMQSVGIGKFEWVHSGGGQHPRKSHQAMSGKIFSFDNLPVINKEQVANGAAEERGIPGQAPNCKCTMVPVIEFEDGDEEK